MYRWVRTQTKGCLTCRKNKQKRKDQKTAPDEKWGEVPYPLHIVQIDHKGPLNTMSDSKQHCLVVIDAFRASVKCIQLNQLMLLILMKPCLFSYLLLGCLKSLFMIEELPS